MFAIVDIAGQQFKVQKDMNLYVHHIAGDNGSSLEFDKVLLVNDGGIVRVGTPTVSGALVKASVVENLVKGDKVIIFKKKRRKGYKLMRGHRQQFSKIKIEAIIG